MELRLVRWRSEVRPASRVLGHGHAHERGRLDRLVGDVDPEAIGAAVEPEPHDPLERRAHLRVPPVEVRLLRQERVEEVLARRGIQCPGRSLDPLEHRAPGIRWPAVRCRVGPDVPVPLRVRYARPRFDEPRVLVRGMVRHEVDDDPDPPLVGRGEQLVEVGEGPELRIDVAVVGHVVPEVGHRRRVERRDPDRIDAERIGPAVEVIEVGGDAAQVADPVAVRVREAPRIDLVEDPLAPPLGPESGPRTAHRPTA